MEREMEVAVEVEEFLEGLKQIGHSPNQLRIA